MATNISPLVLLITSLSLVHCELFTAIVHMEGLLSLERGLMEGLNEYITAEKERYFLEYHITIAHIFPFTEYKLWRNLLAP